VKRWLTFFSCSALLLSLSFIVVPNKASASAGACTIAVTDYSKRTFATGEVLPFVLVVRSDGSTNKIAKVRVAKAIDNSAFTWTTLTVDTNSYGFVKAFTNSTASSFHSGVGSSPPYTSALSTGEQLVIRGTITLGSTFVGNKNIYIEIDDSAGSILNCYNPDTQAPLAFLAPPDIGTAVSVTGTPNVSVTNTPNVACTSGCTGGGGGSSDGLTAEQLHDMGVRWAAWGLVLLVGWFFIKAFRYQR